MTEYKKSNFQISIIAIDSIMNAIENIVCIFSFVSMAVLVLAGITTRFILHIPFMWVEEAARYLMVTGVFIGVSMAMRERAHVGLTGLVEMLPAKICKALKIGSETVTILAFGLFTYYSLAFLLEVRLLGQKTPALSWPMWVIYIPLSIGFFMTTIRALLRFWNDYLIKDKILKEFDDQLLNN